MTERNNVLYVILDSVRAENTSLHGYDRETTPFLSAFADRSTVYRQARAPGIHSIASHVSMFTGAHVEQHQAMRHTAQIDPETTIWHELAADHGYNTGLFTNNRIVSDASNLADSFDHVHEPDYPLPERLEDTFDDTIFEKAYYRWHDALSRAGEYTGTALEKSETAAAAYDGISNQLGAITDAVTDSDDDSSGYKTLLGTAFTDAFLEWERRQSGPWAACINLMDAHSPYEPESEYDRWATEDNWHSQSAKPSIWETLRGHGWADIEALEPLYDGTIRQADAVVHELVEQLEAQGLLSETLLIVTSDHGEAFGEQSRLNPDLRVRDHKWGIHEVLTHVPLLVSYPDQQEGRIVDRPVSLTDIPDAMGLAAEGTELPALADTGELGADDDPLATDEVLASTFRLPEEKTSKYSSIADIDRYVGPWRAVYEPHDDGVRKYAQKGEHYLTLDIDTDGSTTVVSREPNDRVAEAYDGLADGDILTRESAEIDDNLEQQLEDLGYIR
ncbi:MAG: sulfatase-like hydrolase/transferase [Halovenus sp.]